MNAQSKMERFCPDCGSPISGRKDRKFCSDMCRINHHNVLYSQEHKTLRKINARLKHNRSILERLYKNGTRKTSGTFLESLGFSPFFHTHTQKRNESMPIRFCYEYGIYQSQEDYWIVKDEWEEM